METKYVLVIDTDEYAGNFERAMCAFCTGQTGDCGVGIEEQKEFDKDYSEEYRDELYAKIEWRPDEHGCYRPCSIIETPSYSKKRGKNNCNSVAIYFFNKPSKKIINMIKKRAMQFVTKTSKLFPYNKWTMKILGFRLIEETLTVKEVKI